MNDFFSNPYVVKIIAGLITAAIIALVRYVYFKILSNKYSYLIGNWHSYYLMKNDSLIMEQKITVKVNLLKTLSVKIEEKSVPNYIYFGKLKTIDDCVYGNLKGRHHPAKSFLVLKIPFNRKGKVPTLTGVFSGITQDKEPASVVVYWSRSDKTKAEVKKELGRNKKMIIVKGLGKENKLRTLVDENKHRN